MKKILTEIFPVVIALAFSAASVSAVAPVIAATPSSSTSSSASEGSMEKIDKTKKSNPQWKGGLPHTIEGQVLKIDGNIYTVRDSAGRELRVHVDQNTQSDTTIKVGDRVRARIGHVPSDVYARSFQKWSGKEGDRLTKEGEPILFPTVEGEILKREGDTFVLRDLSGQEVRLQVDKSTKLDSNLTPGDKVVARIDSMTAPNYATSLTKKGRVGE